jgi:type II secretory pathway pseudopilin PulG
LRTFEASAARAQSGFAYVLLLISVAVIGVMAAGAVSIGSTMARRDAEQQLLAIGTEFEAALRSYAGLSASVAAVSPGRGPKTLEDLLKDPRAPGVRRHLRQIYADPLTGKAEWGVTRDELGTIAGVHSLAGGTPIKQAGFSGRWEDFNDAASYRQWVFGMSRPVLPSRSGTATDPRTPASGPSRPSEFEPSRK